jgi:hypothetical protein
MQMFERDLGITIVPSRNSRTGSIGAEVRTLKVGESFFVPDGYDGASITSVSSSAKYARRVLGFDLVTRRMTEGGVKGTRVWRVA